MFNCAGIVIGCISNINADDGAYLLSCYNGVAMLNTICQRVSASLQRHDLSGSKMVVAVSGGADSVCLLHTLVALKSEFRLDLYVAHLNHLLRGEESRADAEYVAALAYKMGLTVDIGQVDVNALRLKRKVTLEEAARDARYYFLAQVAHKYDTDLIITGHTQNDQVETLLLHIIRGSGLRGLIGLQPVISRTIDAREVIIVRPMLDITRSEAIGYCARNNLWPRVDSSNTDQALMRNRIRLQLLPLLETYNPDISNALLRMSAVAGDVGGYIDEQVLHIAKQVMTWDGKVVTLDKKLLAHIPKALVRHLLRNCFELFPEGLRDIESVHIEDMLLLMAKPAGRQLSLPRGLVFLIGYDCYWLGQEDHLPHPFPPLEKSYQLLLPGSTVLSGWRVEASIVNCMDQNDNPMTAYVDMDAVGDELYVRCWQESDCFQPLGLGSTKKLGKFMIDTHIPRIWRKTIPVVVSPRRIAWLVGYRLDEHAKITSQSRRIMRIQFLRI